MPVSAGRWRLPPLLQTRTRFEPRPPASCGRSRRSDRPAQPRGLGDALAEGATVTAVKQEDYRARRRVLHQVMYVRVDQCRGAQPIAGCHGSREVQPTTPELSMARDVEQQQIFICGAFEEVLKLLAQYLHTAIEQGFADIEGSTCGICKHDPQR